MLRGRGVTSSLINGRFFFLVQACIRVCSWHVFYQRNEVWPQLCRSAVPHPARPGWERLTLKRPILHFEMRTIVWICDIKRSYFTWNILYSFWHRTASLRENLAWVLRRCCAAVADGCPVNAALRPSMGCPQGARGCLAWKGWSALGLTWQQCVQAAAAYSSVYPYFGDVLSRNALAKECVFSKAVVCAICNCVHILSTLWCQSWCCALPECHTYRVAREGFPKYSPTLWVCMPWLWWDSDLYLCVVHLKIWMWPEHSRAVGITTWAICLQEMAGGRWWRGEPDCTGILVKSQTKAVVCYKVGRCSWLLETWNKKLAI